MKAVVQHVVVDRDNDFAVMARLSSEGAAQRAADWIASQHSATAEDRFMVRPATTSDGPDTGRNVVRQRGLSFVTTTYDNRGRYKGSCYFDVPLEDVCDGSITGSKAAGEFLQYLASNTGAEFWADQVLAEVGSAWMEPARGGLSKRWAALSFLRIVGGMVRFAVRRCDHQSYVAGQLADHEKDRQWLVGHEAKAKAEFIKRMAKGRARKAAERKHAPSRAADGVARRGARAVCARIEEAVA